MQAREIALPSGECWHRESLAHGPGRPVSGVARQRAGVRFRPMSFKRRVLSALGKDVLLEIGRGLELDVTTRMGVEELRDALAKSKRAKLDAIVQESLSRDTLKDICGAVGLDDTGKEKAALVERILAAGGDKAANGAGYRIDPTAVRGSKAAEGGGALGALLSGLDAVPAKKPPKTRGKTKKGERRRGGVPESEAVIAGTLKAALQQFALEDAQAALDTAVADAYGMPPDQGPTEFLLELNQLVVEDEQRGRKVRGPGLPDHLDPKDPRWFSTDCIEPPPVGS